MADVDDAVILGMYVKKKKGFSCTRRREVKINNEEVILHKPNEVLSGIVVAEDVNIP